MTVEPTGAAHRLRCRRPGRPGHLGVVALAVLGTATLVAGSKTSPTQPRATAAMQLVFKRTASTPILPSIGPRNRHAGLSHRFLEVPE
jgi:hypothetical protein